MSHNALPVAQHSMASTSDGVSTYPTSPSSAKAAADGSLYTAGQGLVSVVNNPSSLQPSSSSSYPSLNQLWCWPAVGGAEAGRWLDVAPAVAPGLLRDVTRVDFADYLNRMSDLHQQFAKARRQQREDSARRRSVSSADGTLWVEASMSSVGWLLGVVASMSWVVKVD